MKKSLISILTVLALIGCSKSEENASSEIPSELVAHQSTLTGSLVQNENVKSPDDFAKQVINDRPNFKSETKNQGQEIDQFISSDKGEFTVVAFWENSDKDLVCKGLVINVLQPVSPDNLQVLKRLVYRLNDSNSIEQAILNNSSFTKLSNGAGITIKKLPDSIQYEIY